MASTIKLGVGALAAGAAGAYFFDSNDGKRRRHVLRDKAVAAVRQPAKKTVAETRRKASYAEGVLHGIAHQAAESEEKLKGDPGIGGGATSPSPAKGAKQ